ncbi:quinone-dependent dihydroorotate dehydrogenase [Cerasicoccus arenae]|uniref:Dihydroorotate dehydrogenase (quinone) n=1 Tax=Cerasicoccus arenae TaxID=424488 RepID=A0A8J3GC02_9BACT|nr:quinone-dependent dihydroorotate dehydrogenase [Cerasicoccus arenae]MBK1859028.1 quinone-dependent dihydroorotate dehydrogenase [Cerasicoccus arenae]GHB94815.1 dihydroorotate dehydrogenase (quinone) [Cerasicoccus arenae]
MGAFYETLVRPYLFRGDPEEAHDRALGWLHMLSGFSPALRLMERYNRPTKGEPIELFGLNFPNPVGLAAGFDKNAHCWQAMAALGFGHVEIGTVTRQEQPGNQKPRVFRYPQHEALINRMGFPNEGADAVAKRLAKAPPSRKRRIPLGINIGKSRVTPVDQAVGDYLGSYEKLADFADYFAINVSSPNTPDLRQLQQRSYLSELVGAVIAADRDRARKLGKERIPMLIKIAPDLSYREIDEVLTSALEVGADGIIATNTLLDRPVDLGKDEVGGLSGSPIHRRAVDVVNYMYRSVGDKLPIIGVGGIHDERSAGDFFDAGAKLIQIYTGMIYRGPFFAKDLAQAFCWRTEDWA